MSKILAITPSFAAWRCAADRLLSLETALALSKRTHLPGPVKVQAPEEAELQELRLRADELFQVAQSEMNAMRGQIKTLATKRHPFEVSGLPGELSPSRPGASDRPRGDGGRGTPAHHTR